ncbi:hypothetical protein ACIPC1_32500 [Streptomyces sp. NPDC087263]
MDTRSDIQSAEGTRGSTWDTRGTGGAESSVTVAAGAENGR